MGNFLSRYAIYIYAVLRIVSGFLFIWHGSQKLFGFPPSDKPAAALTALTAAGGGIELIGGLLIMIGLFTSVAAFVASGTMAVAYFLFHFQSEKFLPIQNGGELAAVYCFLFLYLAARGSGVWSVESMFKGSRAAIPEIG